MSSSKIQSRNIDLSIFDGVAKENTSQEILEKIQNAGASDTDFTKMKYASVTCSTITTTKSTKTFTFNGAKKVHNCFLFYTSGGDICGVFNDLIITIDGTSYNCGSFDNTAEPFQAFVDYPYPFIYSSIASVTEGRHYCSAGAYLDYIGVYGMLDMVSQLSFKCNQSVSFTFSLQSSSEPINDFKVVIVYEDL